MVGVTSSLATDPVVEEVRFAILQVLPSSKASLLEVATYMKLGPRTLSRRLSASGTRYSNVLNQVRLDLATLYLLEGKTYG